MDTIDVTESQIKSTLSLERVDLIPILKELVKDFTKEEIYILLEPYHLIPYVFKEDFSAIDINHEKRQALTLRLKENESLFKSKWQWLIDVIVKPWMLNKNGFAYEYELEECLELTTIHPRFTPVFLEWVSDIYLPQKKFYSFLVEIEEDIYGVNDSVRVSYLTVVEKAKSYFYRPKVTYTLKELTAYLLGEFALKWQCYSEDFVLQVLKTSKCFSVRKRGSSGLIINRL